MTAAKIMDVVLTDTPTARHIFTCAVIAQLALRSHFHHMFSLAQVQGLSACKHLSSTRHVSSYASPDTEHQHKFSHLLLLCYCVPIL